MAIDLESVRAKVNETGLFRKVSDVAALADAIDNPGSLLPAAFVVIPSESAEPSRTIGAARQKITARISVAFVVQAQRVKNNEVEAIRSAVKHGLLGFRPTGAEHGLSYVSSRIPGISRGFVWVEVMFVTSYLLSD